jgi:XTP/dITP diphosphohydrolase
MPASWPNCRRCLRRWRSDWCRRPVWASTRPRNRIPPSSRTHWPRRATPPAGLCVEALDGAPGVVSAHFAAARLTDADREARRRVQDSANNQLLLQRLRGAGNRRASFVCTLVALRSANDPQPLIATGCWHGEILTEPRGQGGFGYDPLMFIPALHATVAELPRELKNVRSHRALAGRQMLQLMRERRFLVDA